MAGALPTIRSLWARRWLRRAAVLALVALVLATLRYRERWNRAGPVRGSGGVTRVFLPHPDRPGARVELYVGPSPGAGRHPAIVYVHGHQSPLLPGGRAYVDWGVLTWEVGHGRLAVAVSQPGYGASDGPSDYCGPDTQHAVAAAIRYLRARPDVDPARVAIEGVSRGAIVAAMVASADPSLAAVVLVSGEYDLRGTYRRLAAASAADPLLRTMAMNIRHEAGTSDAAFRDRSALLTAAVIRSPTLILHGARDERLDPQHARQLAARLAAAGTEVRLVVYPRAGHGIPLDDRVRETLPFLDAHLRGGLRYTADGARDAPARREPP